MRAVAAAYATVIFLSSIFVVTNARADALKDCNTSKDPDRQIKGCTSLINGKKLDKENLAIVYSKRGEAYYMQKDNESALADLRKCIKVSPKDISCWALKAAIHDDKQEIDEEIHAYTVIDDVLKKGGPLGDEQKAMLVMMDLQVCSVLLKRANAAYDKVLLAAGHDPGQGKPLDDISKKDLEAAVGDSNTCLRFVPDDSEALAKRALYSNMLGQRELAVADASKAYELNPKSVDAVVFLAATALQNKDYARSLKLAEEWRHLLPHDMRAADLTAQSLDGLGRKDEADALRKVVESKHRCDSAIDAVQQKKETNLDEGIAACSAVIETKAVDQQWLVGAYEYRALLNAQKKNYEGTVADYTRCLDLAGGEGQNVLYYRQRGNYLVELGQYQRAVADFDAALKQAPDDANSLENRAFSYRQLGQLEKAKSDYTQLKLLNPNRVSVYAQLGDIETLNKNFAAALENYSKLIELVPPEGRVYQARASSLEQLGRKDEAIADYRKALGLEPTLTESIEGLKRLGSTP
jgi:tetratricopeptide (TPR) repeat protein